MTEKVEQDKELIKYLKRIAQQNELKFMVFRGCMTGIFTALGTLIGLGIIVFIGIRLLPGLSLIPIVDEILRVTKLDVLIENQVNQLTGQDNETATDNTNTDTDTPVVATMLKYKNESIGLEFEYPSSFSSVVVTDNPEIGSFKEIVLSGEGSLISLQIYVNQTTSVVGNSTQRFINRPNNERVTMELYESGALIGGEQFNNTIYTADLSGDNSYQFIGISDAQLPKTAREVFVGIIESVVIN